MQACLPAGRLPERRSSSAARCPGPGAAAAPGCPPAAACCTTTPPAQREDCTSCSRMRRWRLSTGSAGLSWPRECAGAQVNQSVQLKGSLAAAQSVSALHIRSSAPAHRLVPWTAAGGLPGALVATVAAAACCRAIHRIVVRLMPAGLLAGPVSFTAGSCTTYTVCDKRALKQASQMALDDPVWQV